MKRFVIVIWVLVILAWLIIKDNPKNKEVEYFNENEESDISGQAIITEKEETQSVFLGDGTVSVAGTLEVSGKVECD